MSFPARARRLRVFGVIAATMALACGDADGAPGESGAAEFSAPPEGNPIDLATAPADSLLAAGLDLYRSDALDSARIVLRAAATRAAEAGDPRVQSDALVWLGYAERWLFDYAASRTAGETALRMKIEHGLEDELWRAYNALGLLSLWESRLPSAARMFDSAMVAAERTGDRSAMAKIAGNQGLVHYDLGNFEEARHGFEQLREVARELGDQKEEGNALSNLGMYEANVGNPRAAIPLLEASLVLHREIGYSLGEQASLGHLGTAYMSIGELGEAHATLDTALAIARAQGARSDEAQNLQLVAALYRTVGDDRRALQAHAEARQIFLEQAEDIYAGSNLRSEAEIYAALGDLEAARERALHALEVHRNAGAPFDQLRDRLALAEIAQLGSDTSGARSELMEATRLAEDLDATIARHEVALAEARVSEAADRPARVLRALQAADLPSSATGFASEWEAAALATRAHLRLGQLPEAVENGRRAIGALERVRGTLGSGVLRSSFTAARARTFADYVDALLRSGQSSEAFEVADAARGRTLREYLAAGNAETFSDPVIRTVARAERLLRRIDRLLTDLDQMAALPRDERDPATVSELSELLRSARSEYEALYARLGDEAGPAAAALGAAPVRTEDVQSALAPGEALIEYLVTPDRLLIFVLTRDRLFIGESPITEANLSSRVRVARDRLARRDVEASDVEDVLETLYQTLVEPAIRTGSLTEIDRLVIVPHGSLAYLPFGALRDPLTGRYLTETHALTHLPSAAALPLLRRAGSAPTTTSDRAMDVFAPFPARLPASRTEAETVSSLSGSGSMTLAGRASEAAVRRALVREGDVHVASHASLVPENPMFSRLELAEGSASSAADDGRLEVHEVLQLRIRSPMIYLSGCETGLGRAWSSQFARGEDFATLSQAFLYAGAERVIATLWRVEDEGAAEFASRFYRALAADPDPAAALARARSEMMRSDRYRSPYYWAAYRLSGG